MTNTAWSKSAASDSLQCNYVCNMSFCSIPEVHQPFQIYDRDIVISTSNKTYYRFVDTKNTNMFTKTFLCCVMSWHLQRTIDY